MFKARLNTNFTYTDRFGVKKIGKRITTYGQLYNGDSIAIDNCYQGNKLVEKRYVIWNNFMQKIVNKIRRPSGRGFETVG